MRDTEPAGAGVSELNLSPLEKTALIRFLPFNRTKTYQMTE
jgi:hypothetical protein